MSLFVSWKIPLGIYLAVTYVVPCCWGFITITEEANVRTYFRIMNSPSPHGPFTTKQKATKEVLFSGAILSSLLLSFTSIKRIFSDNEEYTGDHRNLFSKYIKGNDCVLEIGYGKGANAEYYPDNISLFGLDPIVFGVENNNDNKNSIITNGNKYYLENNGKLNDYSRRGVYFKGVVKGVGESLPFLSESFDVVVATLVLCSVQDPPKVLQEVSRVLKKGGIMYVYMMLYIL